MAREAVHTLRLTWIPEKGSVCHISNFKNNLIVGEGFGATFLDIAADGKDIVFRFCKEIAEEDIKMRRKKELTDQINKLQEELNSL